MKKPFAIIVQLVFISSTLVAQEGFPFFTKEFPPEEFAAHRAKVYDAIGSSALALIQGAPSQVGYVRFRQSNEFYYLCGVEIPHSYLLLDGSQRRATLYLPHRNEGRERGEGKALSPEEPALVKQLTGLDAVYGIDLLAEHLARYARGTTLRTIFTPFSPAEGFAVSRDLALRKIADAASDPFDGELPREGRFVQHLQSRFPQFEIKNLTPTLDNLRLIKSPREIAVIKKSTQIAGLALMECMRSTRPGIMEYELDAVAKYVYYRNGTQGEAYFSIIASGPNAMLGHYNAGKRQMQDGDMLLLDFGPDYGYYMSDLTRVWPVNGKFSKPQRSLYDFYIGCYRAILKAIQPGQTAQQILREAVQVMDDLLSKTTFANAAHEKGARQFVDRFRESAKGPQALLGHWVGMSTHDVGQDYGPLRPGMVFTIEPSLLVPEENLNIRCEDMIVITEQKAEIISDFLPLDAPAIEKLMQDEGMLQRFPRAPQLEH
jgi:Xaa-Pro aminopeptidase